MFTGLIEKIGELKALERADGGWTIVVQHAAWDTPLREGESVAVQGACLTVARCTTREFACDVLDETLAHTNLGGKPRGAALNLERALRMGDRLGGHLVAGHVDAVGSVERMLHEGADQIINVRCPSSLTDEMVVKGSVALDGVSLTVTDVEDESFAVHIIPVTWQQTTLGGLRTGDSINIETDMIGKFVRKQLGARSERRGLQWEALSRAGYI